MNVVINQHLIILPGPDFDLFIETRAMYRLEDYIKMFQPAEDDKAILLYGSKYKLWLLGTYIDTATCVHDDHLGVTFQNHVTVNGELLQFVYVADTYELMIETRKQKASN